MEHVYSQTEDDRVMVTARFLVGTKSEDAILRVHEKIRANLDRIPVGIPEPLIVGRGINDVSMAVLTLSSKPDAAGGGRTRTSTNSPGGGAQQIRVEPDPEKLSLFGVTPQHLVGKVKDANRSFLAGTGIRQSFGSPIVGPFVSGRIIDVSQIAAHKLGFADLTKICLKILSAS